MQHSIAFGAPIVDKAMAFANDINGIHIIREVATDLLHSGPGSVRKFADRIGLQQSAINCEHIYIGVESFGFDHLLRDDSARTLLGDGICWLASFSVIGSGLQRTSARSVFSSLVGHVRNSGAPEVIAHNNKLPKNQQLPFLQAAEPWFVSARSGELESSWFAPQYVDNATNFLSSFLAEKGIPLRIGYDYIQRHMLQALRIDTRPNVIQFGEQILSVFEKYGHADTGLIVPATVHDKATRKSGGHMVAITGTRRRLANGKHCAIMHDSNRNKEMLLDALQLGRFFAGQGIPYIKESQVMYSDYRAPLLTISRT